MSNLVNIPLSSDAEQYFREIERKRIRILSTIASLPVGILIWESLSDESNPMCNVRRVLKSELIRSGHLAVCSEELVDLNSPFSVSAQRFSNLEAYDLVLSVPDTIDEVLAIREMTRKADPADKIITYINRQWNTDPKHQVLLELQSKASDQIVPYSVPDLPGCIIDHALGVVLRFQETQYILGRRI